MRTPEPRLIRSYTYAWQQFQKYFLHLFLVGLIVGVASIPSNVPAGDRFWSADMAVLSVLAAAYLVLILPVIVYGAQVTYLKYMRDEQADIRGVFAGFQTNYLNIVLANLLVFAIVGIGVVLLIVPGIIFGCRLSFVPYLVMDRGLDPVAAIEKSWSMTRGHGWRIFGMYLVSIPLMIVGFLLLFVGAFFAWILISCAFASLYHAIDLKDQAVLDANGVA